MLNWEMFWLATVVAVTVVPGLSEPAVKLLECYPFPLLDQPVELIEGFAVYDGNLNDIVGAPHKGIDYVRRENGQLIAFPVCAMHAGRAVRGWSVSWGKFVRVRKIVDHQLLYDTLYAHLATVADDIPDLRNPEAAGLPVTAGSQLGMAGTTGDTKGLIQLHIELHRLTDRLLKLDPYGLNDRFSSGKYPQPGQSLTGLSHYWVNDDPPFAKGDR